MLTAQDQFKQAYEVCKAQAAVDGAFPEALMQHWFETAWDMCAEMIGLIYPPREITESITLDDCGNFTLSAIPAGEVRIFAGYQLLMILPPSLQRSRCDASLCCHCNLTARYMIGSTDPCQPIPPRFVQAVARVFTFLVENRGDSESNDQVLARCGALRFLSPDLTYVA